MEVEIALVIPQHLQRKRHADKTRSGCCVESESVHHPTRAFGQERIRRCILHAGGRDVAQLLPHLSKGTAPGGGEISRHDVFRCVRSRQLLQRGVDETADRLFPLIEVMSNDLQCLIVDVFH